MKLRGKKNLSEVIELVSKLKESELDDKRCEILKRLYFIKESNF